MRADYRMSCVVGAVCGLVAFCGLDYHMVCPGGIVRGEGEPSSYGLLVFGYSARDTPLRPLADSPRWPRSKAFWYGVAAVLPPAAGLVCGVAAGTAAMYLSRRAGTSSL